MTVCWDGASRGYVIGGKLVGAGSVAQGGGGNAWAAVRSEEGSSAMRFARLGDPGESYKGCAATRLMWFDLKGKLSSLRFARLGIQGKSWSGP